MKQRHIPQKHKTAMDARVHGGLQRIFLPVDTQHSISAPRALAGEQLFRKVKNYGLQTSWVTFRSSRF